MPDSSDSIEKLLKTIPNYYQLVLVSARRANELAAGNQPLVLSKSKKPGIIALQEITRGKINYEEQKAAKAKKAARTKKAQK